MSSYQEILAARKRIAPFVKQTPIFESSLLNEWLGSRILFKAECFQTTGAFKLRGATNILAKLAEKHQLPKQIVANSSGNHAQAVAYAGKLFNVPVKIFSTENISAVKAAATKFYGAQLALYPTRPEADEAVKEAAREPDTLWIPPFNHPDIIAGQGTLVCDAIDQVGDIDAVAAPCGGGGLLSGTILATRALCPKAEILGAEPLAANDAARSLREGQILSLDGPPKTMADGAATPSVGEHTFEVLKQVDHFFEVPEHKIAYWTQWLQHLLKVHMEPTSAMATEAVVQWLSKTSPDKKVLVLLSGGNIDANNMQRVWAEDHLTAIPALL